MDKEQSQEIRRLVFGLYDKAAELMGIFSKDEIELQRYQEELKKIPWRTAASFTFHGSKQKNRRGKSKQEGIVHF